MADEPRRDWRRSLAVAIVVVTFALPGCPAVLVPALIARHFLNKDRPNEVTSTAQPSSNQGGD